MNKSNRCKKKKNLFLELVYCTEQYQGPIDDPLVGHRTAIMMYHSQSIIVSNTNFQHFCFR